MRKMRTVNSCRVIHLKSWEAKFSKIIEVYISGHVGGPLAVTNLHGNGIPQTEVTKLNKESHL